MPALLGAIPIKGRVLEPAAAEGISQLGSNAPLLVKSFDLRAYEDPLVPDIGLGDIRKLKSLAGFSWAVTKLAYGESRRAGRDCSSALGIRDRCGVALLVRVEWPIARAGRNPIHSRPWFHRARS